MHLNSLLAFRRYALPYLAGARSVLEIGPDANPSTYRQAAGELNLEWMTADLADDLMPKPSAFRPAQRPTYEMRKEYEIPIPDASIDIVIAGQVVEHVRKIWIWIAELARVTRPGGHLVIISPISWPYHEAPIDCWRIYPEGMRALCDEAGLVVEICEKVALEPRRSRRTYFGESWEYIRKDRPANFLERSFRARVGWPTPTSLDLITIATKPGSTDDGPQASVHAGSRAAQAPSNSSFIGAEASCGEGRMFAICHERVSAGRTPRRL
jgi:SAM-dependent methyltransferase